MDDIIEYIKALNEAQEQGKTDFICPICGGTAHWSVSQDNGHTHSKCDGCGMRVME